MRLIRWSVDHPAAILATWVGLIALSIVALWLLVPTRLMPYIESPMVAVVTEAMTLPAESMEEAVSTPLERGLADVAGVKYVRSTSMHGMSIVTLEFPYHYDMRRAMAEVTARVQGLQNDLRLEGVRHSGPRVLPVDPLNIPVLRLAVRAPGWDPAALVRFLDTVVAARLKQLPDVDSVYTFGGVRPHLDVEVDRVRLAARGLTLLDVRRALEGAGVGVGGGTLESITGPSTVVVVEAPEARLRSLEAVVIGTQPASTNTDGLPQGPAPPRGKALPVLLRDVARLHVGPHSDAPVYRFNGLQAVELNIVQRPDASSPRTLRAVRAALADLARSHPGLTFEEAYDNAHFVGILWRNVWIELGLAVFLTGLVVYLFLGDIRGTLIALVTIPISLGCAVIFFIPLGLSLNSSTLVGLLLAIGRLVDDTIIDLHSVRRHLAQGKDARLAAIDGCTEVRRAVISATVLICLAMLPLTFAGGLTQDMFTGIVWPFLLALAASLAVALTLTPLLCAWAFRGVRVAASSHSSKLEEGYRGLLRLALANGGVVLCGALAACYLAYMLFPLIGSEMMPLADTGQIYAVMETRPGTSTAETSRLATMLEEILRRQPEVMRVSTEVGSEPGGAFYTGYGVGGGNTVTMWITLTDKDARQRSIWDIADGVWDEAARTIPNVRRLSLKEMGSDVMASAMAPVQLVIHGPDRVRLSWLAERTAAIANKIDRPAGGSPADGLFQVGTTWSLAQGAWTLRVDALAAARLGLSPAQITEQAWFALGGGQTPTPLVDGTTVMLAYRGEQRRTVRDLAEVVIIGSHGERVPLRTVATFKRGAVADMIEHDGLQRCDSVVASYRNGGQGSMQLSMDLLMRSRMDLPYPAGYDIEQRGDMTQMMDAFSRLLWGLGIALVLMYLALVMQFGSLLVPLAILAAIPLELLGVFVALLIARQTFSTVSLLGLVVLNGMDVTASILLLDAVLIRRAAGASVDDAVLEAAPTRLRPVLMTVVVTMAVMIPMAFFPRTGIDAYAPLATVVVGGLSMSTVLTLIVVPILYRTLQGRDRN